MGTAIGAAMDYLVTTLPSLVTVAVPSALVVDAITSDSVSDSMLYVGRSDPLLPRAATGTRLFPTFGTRNIDERFMIGCLIDVYRDGTVMKTARDAALAIYDVVCHLMVTDPSMGGTLKSTHGEISDVAIYQMDDAGTARRRVALPFTITAQNRYGA